MFGLTSSLVPESWDKAKALLELALGSYTKEAQGQVKLGNEAVYRVGNTALLLRGERFESGHKELVVVGLTGHCQQSVPAVIQHAKLAGFDSVRAHTRRKGMLRLLRQCINSDIHVIERRGDECILQIRFNDGW